jgi:hypothetical protein
VPLSTVLREVSDEMARAESAAVGALADVQATASIRVPNAPPADVVVAA